MTNVFFYDQRFKELLKAVNIYQEGERQYSSSGLINPERRYKVRFYKNKLVKEEDFQYERIRETLFRKNDYKMVIIEAGDYKRDVYYLLGEITKKKGYGSPFIANDNSITYFPKLRYSDIELLKHLCEQKMKKNDYKILVASAQ